MNKLLSLLAAIIIAIPTTAQINLGLKGGANYSFTDYKTDLGNIDVTNSASWCGGAFVRVKIKKFHLMGEGLFTGHQGGMKFDIGEEQKINFYTVDVPLLLGGMIIDAKVAKLRYNLGVVPSFTVVKLGDLTKEDYKDSYISAAAGISLDIPLFIFELRYQGGLGEFHQVANNLENTSITNNMLTLSAGWKIL
jgi:hypothetical protein